MSERLTKLAERLQALSDSEERIDLYRSGRTGMIRRISQIIRELLGYLTETYVVPK